MVKKKTLHLKFKFLREYYFSQTRKKVKIEMISTLKKEKL